MKFIRKKISFVSLFMAAIMLLITVPYQSLFAAMVSTEATIYQIKAQDARTHLKTLISRNDIKKSLISQGIDPDEAKARVDSLSDPEAIAVADQINKVPAGGGAFGALIGAALIVFLVLLVTDILGYTDIFPFVKSQKK
ncbi:MAG: PA2779 family protein [Deltaproteobacteria bacterium]|nr:PA2779 family protein [Deltaproteobacteria bacterium]